MPDSSKKTTPCPVFYGPLVMRATRGPPSGWWRPRRARRPGAPSAAGSTPAERSAAATPRPPTSAPRTRARPRGPPAARSTDRSRSRGRGPCSSARRTCSTWASVSLGVAPGGGATAQRGRPALLPAPLPAAHTLGRHPEPARDLSLRAALLPQLSSTHPPRLTRLRPSQRCQRLRSVSGTSRKGHAAMLTQSRTSYPQNQRKPQ